MRKRETERDTQRDRENSISRFIKALSRSHRTLLRAFFEDLNQFQRTLIIMQKFLIKSSSSSNASTCSIASNNTNNNGNNSSNNSNGGSLLDARYHQRKKTKVSNLGQVGFGQGDLSKWHSKNDALGVRVEPMNALTTGAEKIAAFDLDGTIQTTKDYRMKDRPYMVSNCDGFKFRSPIVKEALSELYRAGWKIVIFSNQSQAKGAMNGVSARKIRERVDLLAAEVRLFSFSCFFCI